MPLRLRVILISIALTSGAVAAALAQAPTLDRPSFEVASIKRNSSGTGSSSILVQPGGRFVATNVPAGLLMRNAYQLEDFQLVGAPSWFNTDRYDIEAKGAIDVANLIASERNAGPNPLQLMIQSLLAERFKLAAHAETRNMPVYAMVLARPDGQLGSGLKVSRSDCWTAGPSDAGNRNTDCTFGGPAGRFHAASASMLQIARAFEGRVSRPVIDRTGLQGFYDVDLTWSPTEPARARSADANEPAIDPSGPSIFTAMQEQLGLKLESTTGPADVLVIDHIERPTED